MIFSDDFFIFDPKGQKCPPKKSAKHYAKRKDWSKVVSKVFLLDLMAFLMHINVRPKKSSQIFFYCPPYCLKDGQLGVTLRVGSIHLEDRLARG